MSVLSSSLPTWSFSSAPQRRSSSERRTEPQAGLAGSPSAMWRGESPQAHMLARHTPLRATIGGEVGLSYSYAPVGHASEHAAVPSVARLQSTDTRCLQAPLLRAAHVGSVSASSLAPAPLVRRSVATGCATPCPVGLQRGRAMSSRPPDPGFAVPERHRSTSPVDNGSPHGAIRHQPHVRHFQMPDAEKIDEALRG
eukprot:6096689-Amphidinium_carterae.1